MELERLLRSQGFGSKSETRAMILSGRVSVRGELCRDPHADVDPVGFSFVVDEVEWHFCDHQYIAMNKPAHYECSAKPSYYPSVYTLLPKPLLGRGVQTVGRLDEDTTGLLILSDDGQFIHSCISPKKKLPKVYRITTKHPVSPEMAEQLCAGVQLKDEPGLVAAAACSVTGENELQLTITEGKYHQVKRMIAAAGNRVEALHRIAFGALVLPDRLQPGEWCYIKRSDVTGNLA